MQARLEAMALSFVLPYRHPYTNEAIDLACELLARDLDTRGWAKPCSGCSGIGAQPFVKESS
jgi:hypothetical protein